MVIIITAAKNFAFLGLGAWTALLSRFDDATDILRFHLWLREQLIITLCTQMNQLRRLPKSSLNGRALVSQTQIVIAKTACFA